MSRSHSHVDQPAGPDGHRTIAGQVNTTFSTAANQIGLGVVLIDLSSEVRFINTHAKAVLSAQFTTGMSLPAALSVDGAQWEKAMAGAMAGRRVMLRAVSNDKAFSVSVLPCAEPDDTDHLAVLIEHQPHDLNEGFELFARRFNLSVAETQVFLGLVNGRVPKQIACARQVALSTVRYQIKQILTKTNASTVNALTIQATRYAALETNVLTV
jgi:DNA-binding CsgD family transcriptional regulator